MLGRLAGAKRETNMFYKLLQVIPGPFDACVLASRAHLSAQMGRPGAALAALKRNTELQPMSPYGW